MHNYYFKIEVRGRGQFPIDQLRRFEMFPIDVDTVTMIECSFNRDMATRKYTLGMYASSLSADNACIDRFRSFGFIGTTTEIWKEDALFEQNGEIVPVTGQRADKLKLSAGINWERR